MQYSNGYSIFSMYLPTLHVLDMTGMISMHGLLVGFLAESSSQQTQAITLGF